MRRPLLFPGLVAGLLVLALAACGSEEAPPPGRDAPQGREETRGIRNAEAVGYSGDAIADKVDASLDASEQRKREMDAAAAQIDAAEPAEPPPAE